VISEIEKSTKHSGKNDEWVKSTKESQDYSAPQIAEPASVHESAAFEEVKNVKRRWSLLKEGTSPKSIKSISSGKNSSAN